MVGTSEDYKKFQDRIFNEITDLERGQTRSIVDFYLKEYGLTWNDFVALYKPGMKGRDLHNEMWAVRKRTPETQK
jgi:hypothetical protein